MKSIRIKNEKLRFFTNLLEHMMGCVLLREGEKVEAEVVDGSLTVSGFGCLRVERRKSI